MTMTEDRSDEPLDDEICRRIVRTISETERAIAESAEMRRAIERAADTAPHRYDARSLIDANRRLGELEALLDRPTRRRRRTG